MCYISFLQFVHTSSNHPSMHTTKRHYNLICNNIKRKTIIVISYAENPYIGNQNKA